MPAKKASFSGNDNLVNVTSVDRVRLVFKPGIVFKNPVIIEGFQGIGLVGTLSAQYLCQKLNFERVGYVDSEGVPPIALLVNGEVRNPVKIFTNKERSVVIIESELSIPRKIIYELSGEIARWAKSIGAREIVCMEGIAVPEEERNAEVLGMSTDPKLLALMVKKGVKKLDNGIVIGMSAALLLKSIELGVPATCLMVESRSKFPDGLAAAAMLEVIGRVYGLVVDVTELKSQASAFERKIQKVLNHADQLRSLEGVDGGMKKTSIYG